MNPLAIHRVLDTSISGSAHRPLRPAARHVPTAVLGRLGLTALALVTSGCGAGTAAAVFGLNSDDDDPEQLALLGEESIPTLSLTELREPAQGRYAASDPAFRFVTEPVERLELFFSKDVDAASATDPGNVAVSVQRPTGRGTAGTWIPLPLPTNQPLELTTPRRLRVPLAARTQFDGLYRVVLAGIRDADGATTLPTTTSYFVTGAGVWTEPEHITFGEGSVGTTATLSPNLDQYSVIESQFTFQGQFHWTAAIASARFGGPWLVPALAWVSPPSNDPDAFQMNTGSVGFTDELAYFSFQEGDINLPIPDLGIQLRTPIAVLQPNGVFDFEQVAGAPGGLEGVIDQGLPANKLSFRARITGHERRLLASWWAFTEGATGDFAREGVFANDVFVAGGPQSWSAFDWGQATSLSGGAHASWPYQVQLADTSSVVIWWEAANRDELLSRTLGNGGRYRMSSYPPYDPLNPAQSWSTPVTIATGALTPITDVQTLGNARLLILTTGANTPEAWILDLNTLALVGPSVPAGTYTMKMEYEPSDLGPPSPASMSDWRSKPYATTPLATSMGTDQFVVRWIDDVPGQENLKLSIFDATAGTWGPVVDFSSFATAPQTLGIPSLRIDTLGWATFVWNEATSSTESSVNVRRANLVVDGLPGLQDSPPFPTTQTNEVLTTSLPGTFATFPGLSNVHVSGAVSATWNFGIGPISGSNLLGTIACRLQ